MRHVFEALLEARAVEVHVPCHEVSRSVIVQHSAKNKSAFG